MCCDCDNEVGHRHSCKKLVINLRVSYIAINYWHEFEGTCSTFEKCFHIVLIRNIHLKCQEVLSEVHRMQETCIGSQFFALDPSV